MPHGPNVPLFRFGWADKEEVSEKRPDQIGLGY
jgi:hypothetical protein